MRYLKTNETIEYNEYGIAIPTYRIRGTDSDYSEGDAVDINDKLYIKLKTLFEANNIEYTIETIQTALPKYNIVDGQIVKDEPYAHYLKVILKRIINPSTGAEIFKSSFKLYEYNDSNFGIEIYNNHHVRCYVCFGINGLKNFINDNFTFSLD